MKVAGFEFFPNRAELNRVHGTLASRLTKANEVNAIFAVGAKFYDAGERLDVIKRLILPNPDSKSFANYSDNVSQRQQAIRRVTEKAKSRDTDVRWSKDFIFHTLVLTDTDKPTGWAHIESVLPNSTTEQRPSYTIYKIRYDAAVSEMRRLFYKIWDESDIA